ncbi:MAG: Amuc_1100 family pilus-like protein [Luteolibacter sp.]
MNWIKDHTFNVALGGITIAAAGALLFVVSKGESKYEQAKADFDAAVDEARSFESLALYPQAENRDGKQKALDDYRKSLEGLQKAFGKFAPAEIKNISPQDFTSRLVAANDELKSAFEKAGTKLPESFFCGFEGYKSSLARGTATGILDYQLDASKAALMALAAAGPSELKNLHRPALAEEEGNEFKAAENQVARALPIELTFHGSGKSLRNFFTALTKLDKHYAVVRTIRITNAKKEPPRTSDAKFEEQTDAAAPQAGSVDAAFAELTGQQEAQPATEPAAPKAGVRILSQVLGMEELDIFVRIDLMQLLPPLKLP